MCCSSWVRFSEDQRRLDNWIGSRRSLRLRLTRVASHVNLSVWWNVLVWRPCQCRVSCVCQVFGPLPEFLPALCWCLTLYAHLCLIWLSLSAPRLVGSVCDQWSHLLLAWSRLCCLFRADLLTAVFCSQQRRGEAKQEVWRNVCVFITTKNTWNSSKLHHFSVKFVSIFFLLSNVRCPCKCLSCLVNLILFVVKQFTCSATLYVHSASIWRPNKTHFSDCM